MSRAPPRVLHIVESLDKGAVENWLVRMLRHARAHEVPLDWTFYCTLEAPGALDPLAISLGARIVRTAAPLSSKLAFLKAMRSEIRQGGYNVLHGHHDLMCAVYFAASAGLGVSRRVVHAHNADENLPTARPAKLLLLKEPMRRICLSADRVVGISDHTLDTLLAGRRRRPGRDVVHYYGVETGPFEICKADRAAFRAELGVEADTPILLFAGRVTPEKNPVMTIEVLAALRRREPRAVAVFAGVGSLETAVLDHAQRLGVRDAVHMIGWRSDLAEVMSSCDWFILPRPETPKEGFGLAVVEAQLAGLRLLLSNGIPDDPLLPTARFRRLSLAEPPEAWAAAALELFAQPRPSRPEAIQALKRSPMEMGRALDGLMALHA